MNIIKEGCITIHDSQTGQKQTYNLGGIKINQDTVVGMTENLAYYAKIEDGTTIFINCCIKSKESHSFITMLLDYGRDWEHFVSIPIKSEKEQTVDTVMATIKEIVASNSYFVLSKPEEQIRKELMNLIEED